LKSELNETSKKTKRKKEKRKEGNRTLRWIAPVQRFWWGRGGIVDVAAQRSVA